MPPAEAELALSLALASASGDDVRKWLASPVPNFDRIPTSLDTYLDGVLHQPDVRAKRRRRATKGG